MTKFFMDGFNFYVNLAARKALLKYYCGNLLAICRADHLRLLIIAATIEV
jgi:hypothetical protein